MEAVNETLRSDIERAVADAVAAEREACANIADAAFLEWSTASMDERGAMAAAEEIGEKIRARE